MTKSLEVGLAVVLGVALFGVAAPPAHAADEILLVNGERLMGDLQEREFTLQTPQGSYRVTRATVWRLVLNTASGDSVDLRNGNRISGILNQGRYTLRLPGGQTRVVERAVANTVTLGPGGGGQSVRDTLILANGDHVFGDVQGTDFEVLLPTGSQRVNRAALWRFVLDHAVGDTAELLNGDMLSGIVNQGRYSIRTPDGQTLTFGRDEVRVVAFRLPERPRPAAVAPAAPAAAPPAPAVTPPRALPPALRAALRDLYFEFDRSDLTAEARRTLEEVAQAMKAFPGFTLLIEGHADERGTNEYNLALAAKRAQAAKDYLANLGIAADRIDTISYGEERPTDPGHNEMAWALNRRAHLATRAK